MHDRSERPARCATASSTSSPTGKSTAPRRGASIPALPPGGFEDGRDRLFPRSQDGKKGNVRSSLQPNGYPASVGNVTASSRPKNVQATSPRRAAAHAKRGEQRQRILGPSAHPPVPQSWWRFKQPSAREAPRP